MKLRMENYHYPTKEEWISISKRFPKIGRFGFPHVNDLELLLTRKEPKERVRLKQNLFEWDSYLSKKTWNLRQSYVNSVVNLQRGIAIDNDDFEDEIKVIQLFNFEFYTETTFYYVISVRDIICQVINLAFGFGLNEHWLKMEKLMKKAELNKSTGIYQILDDAYSGLKEANDIRNSLAHKFSKLNSDNRSSVSDDGRTYGAGSGYFIGYPKQIEILDNSLDCLETFFLSSKTEISQAYDLE